MVLNYCLRLHYRHNSVQTIINWIPQRATIRINGQVLQTAFDCIHVILCHQHQHRLLDENTINVFLVVDLICREILLPNVIRNQNISI